MDDTPLTPERKTPRWIKVVLTLSLALNLLIIGAVVGVASRFAGPGSGPWHDRAHKRPEAALIASFERGDMRAMFKDMREKRRKVPEGDDIRPLLLEALRAEPFDPDRLREVFALRKNAGQARRAALETALIDKLSEFSAQKRAAYADRLEKALARTKRRH